ncbi:MAG: hypothetical protein M0R33_07760 [Methylomonas sp.]|jgi:phosphate uptake regulator|uniref:PhoU domain-containing protein n=1 Tax=Methylomonas sp. TaxID=418 RepID=UPI0025EC6417|nr:PhoU domain-containing protein [Methylomonas sp.]MCK9606333.1 hypothetical protein [Methylomonas sp.]
MHPFNMGNMKIIDKPAHRLPAADTDLAHLRSLLMDMLQRTTHRLQTAVQALEQADMDLAQTANRLDGDISQHEIDLEAVTFLARYSPVADDLRTVIAS